MNTKIILSSLEELSSLTSSVKIDGCNRDNMIDDIFASIRNLQSYSSLSNEKCEIKLWEIIQEYTIIINSYYNECFVPFDNADQLYTFDKKYDIGKSIRSVDYQYINIFIQLYLLLKEYGGGKYDKIAKKSICNTIGRFLVLYYGKINPDVNDVNSCSQHPYLQTLFLALECISLYNWDVDEVVYLRLTVLNLLNPLGVGSQQIFREIWQRVKLETDNFFHEDYEHTNELIVQCVEKFYQSLSVGKIIEPLDTTWLFAYIHKQRFGYLYCKKITKLTNNSLYQYSFKTTAICFKGLMDRVTGNSSKVVLFEKGIVKRSSEYKPLESSFLFNYTSMKFE